MTPIFHGEIHEGKISLYRKDGFQAEVQKLEGKRVELVLRAHKAKRSNNQNRLYWGIYIPIFAKFLGYDDEEMHEALKLKFLSKEANGPFPTVRSTTTLNTKEFTDYLERIERLAAECGLYIPTAGQVEPAD